MDTTTLAAFLAVDFLLVFTPGADWAYAITAGLRDRSVVPAVAGLVAGYAGYTLLAVAGLVVIVASSGTLLTGLTVAGAGYLVWLGWGGVAAAGGPDGRRAGTGRRRVLPCAGPAPGDRDQPPQPQGARRDDDRHRRVPAGGTPGRLRGPSGPLPKGGFHSTSGPPNSLIASTIQRPR